MFNRSCSPIVLTVTAILAIPTFVYADLQSYNGFDEALGDSESMNGTPISASGYFGNYRIANPDTSISPVFQSRGLAFSNQFFPTKGGAVKLPDSSALIANLDHGLQGEVWHSYLFKLEEFPENYSSHGGTSIRPSGMPASLVTSAKAQNTGINLSSAPRPGVGYFDIPGRLGASVANGVSEATPDGILDGQVYLAISHFSRVGETLSEETPGVASVWVFDTAAYEAWRSSGSLTPDSLDNYALWKGTTTRTNEPQQQSSTSSDTISFSSYLLKGLILDEARIGTSLKSVAVP